jgi:hypothetical protein
MNINFPIYCSRTFPNAEKHHRDLIFCLDVMNLKLHRAIHLLFSYDKFVMESRAREVKSPVSYFGGPWFNSLVRWPAVPTEDLYFPADIISEIWPESFPSAKLPTPYSRNIYHSILCNLTAESNKKLQFVTVEYF